MKHSFRKMVIGVTGVLVVMAAQAVSAIEVIEVREHGFLRSTDHQIQVQSLEASELIGREMVSRINESVLDSVRRNLAITPVVAAGREMHYVDLAP